MLDDSDQMSCCWSEKGFLWLEAFIRDCPKKKQLKHPTFYYTTLGQRPPRLSVERLVKGLEVYVDGQIVFGNERHLKSFGIFK